MQIKRFFQQTCLEAKQSLPSKRRMLIGSLLGLLFYALTQDIYPLVAIIFGIMVWEDYKDHLVDMRWCVLLFLTILTASPFQNWLSFLAFFGVNYALFQGFQYLSGYMVTVPKPDSYTISSVTEPWKEHEQEKETTKAGLPFLPFIAIGIVLFQMQQVFSIPPLMNVGQWEHLPIFGFFLLAYLWDKWKKKQIGKECDGEIIVERQYGFGEGDVPVLAIWGGVFKMDILFVFLFGLFSYLAVYGILYLKNYKKNRS